MRSSEQTNEISAALAAAQGAMKNPEKTRSADYPTKTGGRVKFNYADLASCYDVARESLAKNGLAHVCTTGYVEKNYTLFCRLTHTSGQWFESEWPLPNDEPKVVGAHITYGARYLFTAMTGMAPDEDMDAEPQDGGEYGDRKPAIAPRPVGSVSEKPKHPSEPQIKRLYAIATSAKVPTEVVKDYCERNFKITSTKELTLTQYDQLVQQIESGRIMGEPGSTG